MPQEGVWVLLGAKCPGFWARIALLTTLGPAYCRAQVSGLCPPTPTHSPGHGMWAEVVLLRQHRTRQKENIEGR